MLVRRCKVSIYPFPFHFLSALPLGLTPSVLDFPGFQHSLFISNGTADLRAVDSRADTADRSCCSLRRSEYIQLAVRLRRPPGNIPGI